MDIFDSTWLRTAATAGLAILVAQGLPRALNTLYKWTSAMLFGSLYGRRQAVAMLFSAASFIWVFDIVAAAYSPIAMLLPRVLPYPDGLIRTIIVVEIWVLLIGLPLLMGIAQIYLSNGTILYRLSLIPRAFMHVFGITLALLTITPWVLWRFVYVRLRRMSSEQLRIDIELEKYEYIADRLVASLGEIGLDARMAPLPGPVRLARWFLNRLGPPMLRPKRAYAAKRIVGTGYSLIFFDGLIDIVGTTSARTRVRAAILGKLPPDGLWLTRSEEAREIERRLRARGTDLSTIPAEMREMDISLEEWRILSWEYLQVMSEQAANGAKPAADSAMEQSVASRSTGSRAG